MIAVTIFLRYYMRVTYRTGVGVTRHEGVKDNQTNFTTINSVTMLLINISKSIRKD